MENNNREAGLELLETLEKIAGTLDSRGQHDDADAIDNVMTRLAQESGTHIDSSGVTWTRIGPVKFPNNHVEWENDKGSRLRVSEYKMPETKKKQDQAPSTTTNRGAEISERKVEQPTQPAAIIPPEGKGFGIGEWFNENLVEPVWGN